MAFPEYSFQSKYFTLKNRFRMHYIDEGPRTGTPVILIHGNPTWSYYYRNLISELRKTHRVIAPDHIGMGFSDKPPETKYDYTLASRVADLDALIDYLNFSRPLSYVLHDWGGMIGMGAAQLRPDRVARFVILNTGAFTMPEEASLPMSIKLARTPIVGEWLVRRLNAFARGGVKYCVTKKMPREISRSYISPYGNWYKRVGIHRFIKDIPLKPTDTSFELVSKIEAGLAKFKTRPPMFIAWGMKDFVFTEHFLNRWIELFPRAIVRKFDNAGHYVLEDAAEELIPMISEFLATSEFAFQGRTVSNMGDD